MSSALGCGETGTWSNTRRRWDGCNGLSISATHGIVLCGSLKLYKWCSPSAVSMGMRQPFPLTFINSDEEIISRSSAISISSFKTHTQTHIHTLPLTVQMPVHYYLLLIDRAASQGSDGCLSGEDSWSLPSTYLFCWSNHLWTPIWNEREWC